MPVIKGGLALFLCLLLVGCNADTHQVDEPQRSANEPIGYLGFVSGQAWALQFNDCGVYDLDGAKKYLWFNRNLTQVSCYQVKPDDGPEPIRIYQTPSLDAQNQTIMAFSELVLSPSGWGDFPHVYQVIDGDWYRVKEGWLHLSHADKAYAQFYSGFQDGKAKATHEDYYRNH